MESSDRLVSHILLLGVLYTAWRVSIGGQADGDGAAFAAAAFGAILTWIVVLVVSRAAGRSRAD
jgi:hypothetical protein